MSKEIKKIEVFEKQGQFLNSDKRKGLFDGGIGSGKTKSGALWIALQCLKYKGTSWLMAARDAGQLREATSKELDIVLAEDLQLQEGVHFKKTRSPHLKYEFINGSDITGVGAHNYDSVFRGGNYSGGWGDEVDFWKPEAYEAFMGRIRKPPELMRFTSSPKGYNHVWEDFYNKPNKDSFVVHSTTYDNPTLSQAYIESLKNTYSPKLFQQEVMAKRINLKLGQVYDEFDRERHVRPCKDEYNPAKDQLYFFVDYNISHYCGTYMLLKNGIVYAIGEEHLEFKGTEHMAPIVKAKYPRCIVVGDSAGNNKRDTAITRTNYEIFTKHGLMTKHFTNPPVESRIINAQSRLHHGLIVIDPSCKTLIKDLELLSWKENGEGLDKSDISLSHASDSWSYGVWFHMPIRKIGAPLGSLDRY